MNCLHPFTVDRGDAFTPFGHDVRFFQVPCGHCTACRIQRTSEWSIRLQHELAFYDSSAFLTLTYDDDHLPCSSLGYPTLVKRDAQLFLKRLRKALPDRKIKYFLAGEYGDVTFRPHYHAIMFDVDSKDQKIIDSCWSLGFTMLGTVTPDSCKYVTGYVQKKLYGEKSDEYVSRGVEPVFKLSSQGLGKRFCTDILPKYGVTVSSDGNVLSSTPLTFTVDGVKHGLPNQYKKWLGVKGADYLDYIKEHEKDVKDWYEKRGYDVGSEENDTPLQVALSESRKQYNLDLDKKLSMSKKDKI